jgi:hypothetical protein
LGREGVLGELGVVAVSSSLLKISISGLPPLHDDI